jgi:hypothetical protein
MSTSPSSAIPDQAPPPPPCKAALPLHKIVSRNTERWAPRPWISHLQGRTLVEGIAEAFRHPTPDCPDPFAELMTVEDAGWENLCGVFVSATYPEGKFSPDERERMRDAFRRRFFEGRRDGLAQFRREITEFQNTSPDEAMQMCAGASAWAALHLVICLTCSPPACRERRLGVNKCSEESSRVLTAYFMLAMLRGCGALASRKELQDKGVLEVDCPVCLGQFKAGNGVVIFHVLECGHRYEATLTCAFPRPMSHDPRACVGADAKVDRPIPARSDCRIHKECLLQIKTTPKTARLGMRTCPLCRGASRSMCAFAMHGALR